MLGDHNKGVIMSVMASQITSLICLFSHRWKNTSKLHVTGLCVGNSPATGEFPAQRDSDAENVSIWWRHHVVIIAFLCVCCNYMAIHSLCAYSVKGLVIQCKSLRFVASSRSWTDIEQMISGCNLKLVIARLISRIYILKWNYPQVNAAGSTRW